MPTKPKTKATCYPFFISYHYYRYEVKIFLFYHIYWLVRITIVMQNQALFQSSSKICNNDLQRKFVSFLQTFFAANEHQMVSK